MLKLSNKMGKAQKLNPFPMAYKNTDDVSQAGCDSDNCSSRCESFDSIDENALLEKIPKDLQDYFKSQKEKSVKALLMKMMEYTAKYKPDSNEVKV